MNKTNFAVVGLVAVLAGVYAIWPQDAAAGDDPAGQVAYSAAVGCSGKLRPKTKYAVQCTTDCFVRVVREINGVAASDGGVMSVNATTSILLAAGKLYDTPTTYDNLYICIVQSAASGSAKLFINRGPTE